LKSRSRLSSAAADVEVFINDDDLIGVLSECFESMGRLILALRGFLMITELLRSWQDARHGWQRKSL